MSKRKDAKALARWERDTRQWAIDTGRDLTLDLYYDRDRAARPYGVGVVLDPGEKVWAEVPVRWEPAVGVRVDLTAGREIVGLDIEGQPTLIWSGPGIAPLAVAAIFHLYGVAAMIDHPGLAALRVPTYDAVPQPEAGPASHRAAARRSGSYLADQQAGGRLATLRAGRPSCVERSEGASGRARM